MKRFGLIIAALALCLPATQLAAKTAPIGGARVVVNEVTGKIGGKSVTLRRGDGVFENELISTGDKAQAQFQFIDKTLLTLGEKSDIRLDAYVYNPRRKSGRIVINSLKGAFRFVSGSARKAAYQVKTPLATIGVRGTVIDGFMSSDGQFSVFILQRGKMIVCADGACRPVNKAGFYVVVRADGSITKPRQWTGRVPGITFTSAFPAPGGRFYVDPSHYYQPGEGSGGAGSTGPTGGRGTGQSSADY
ncbi:MAG: hypothetical protein C0605_16935 [Hyphomicrobiales bacterium]|nr:MAG: hypothetical protein C0605_16935 [Hyphomicrobiales bacterium]